MSKIPRALSPGEEAMALHLRAEKILFIREYRFHKERKWRFDFVLPKSRIAIEIEGGIWKRGAHTRGKGFEEDAEKYNAAAKLGFLVLRYSTDMVLAGQAINDVLEMLR
jgi:very-short-patch-repair endonuclease